MSKIAIAVEQTIWDCRWSQPGFRIPGVADCDQPEPLWVCIRNGERRPVSESECAQCPHWQSEEKRWN